MPGVTGKIYNVPEKLKKIRSDSNAQTDPLRNPHGVYSGISKRNAILDGEFVTVENMPKAGKDQPLQRRRRG